METIKHFLGLCGESHPNVFTIILLIVLVKIVLVKLRVIKIK
jgi:hypothetical protein|tara:strand:- start:115 stop:240 length:126 start_codon:yes stop_codon:yes gene_type:complete